MLQLNIPCHMCWKHQFMCNFDFFFNLKKKIYGTCFSNFKMGWKCQFWSNFSDENLFFLFLFCSQWTKKFEKMKNVNFPNIYCLICFDSKAPIFVGNRQSQFFFLKNKYCECLWYFLYPKFNISYNIGRDMILCELFDYSSMESTNLPLSSSKNVLKTHLFLLFSQFFAKNYFMGGFDGRISSSILELL